MKAKWTLDINKAAYRFDTDGGTPATIPELDFDVGGSAGTAFPAAPTRAGYNFLGWFATIDSAEVEITAATVVVAATATPTAGQVKRPEHGIFELKAKWDGKKLTITFNLGTWDGGTAPDPIETKYGATVTLPEPRQYYGANWNTLSTGLGTTYTSTTPLLPTIPSPEPAEFTMTLYAMWAYTGGPMVVEGTGAEKTATVTMPAFVKAPKQWGEEGSAIQPWDSRNEIGATTTYYSGVLAYMLPADTDEFKIADYDFVTLTFEFTYTGTVGELSLVRANEANAAQDYREFAPTTGAYVGMPASGAESERSWEIRGAMGTGIGIRLNAYNETTANGQKTEGDWTKKEIVFSKAVFSQGPRIPIKFDATPAVAQITRVKGKAFVWANDVDPLPAFTPAAGDVFIGWTYDGTADTQININGNVGMIDNPEGGTPVQIIDPDLTELTLKPLTMKASEMISTIELIEGLDEVAVTATSISVTKGGQFDPATATFNAVGDRLCFKLTPEEVFFIRLAKTITVEADMTFSEGASMRTIFGNQQAANWNANSGMQEGPCAGYFPKTYTLDNSARLSAFPDESAFMLQLRGGAPATMEATRLTIKLTF